MPFADPARHLGPSGGWRDPERIASVVAVIIIHLLVGLALVRGLGVTVPAAVSEGLTLLDLAPPPPPPAERKPPPPPRHASRREGAASPPNIRSKATEIVAPTPPVLVVPPPPVVVAPIAGVGADPSAGAAEVRGPGTGSGGVGNGTGSGGRGNGDGDGDGGTDLRLISRGIRPSDYPKAAFRAGAQGTVGLRFTVGVNGRVTDCSVTRSSGNADLDAGTCPVIRKRLRYEPARDAAGRPIATTVIGEQDWRLYSSDQPADNDDDEG